MRPPLLASAISLNLYAEVVKGLSLPTMVASLSVTTWAGAGVTSPRTAKMTSAARRTMTSLQRCWGWAASGLAYIPGPPGSQASRLCYTRPHELDRSGLSAQCDAHGPGRPRTRAQSRDDDGARHQHLSGRPQLSDPDRHRCRRGGLPVAVRALPARARLAAAGAHHPDPPPSR